MHPRWTENALDAGEQAPVTEIYQRHAQAVLLYVRRYMASREDAEDLLLEVFLRAFEKQIPLSLPEEEQRAWLLHVARQKLADYYRQRIRHPSVPLNEMTLEQLVAADEHSPEQVALLHEDHRLLRESFAARIGTRSALDAQPAPEPSASAWTNAGAFSDAPARHKTRPARRPRRVFALVAAVLVAAVLVGSVLWVVGTLHQPGGVVAHPTVSPQLTRTHASTPTPALAPSGRVNAQLVYDGATNTLLLFSGQDYTGAPPLADTWTWNGSTWTRLHPAHSPGPIGGAAIAYDPTTQQVVLFGGISNANTGGTLILGDTWIWNGSDWTQQHPASSPPARVDASLAYDAASGQFVLFGGKHTTGFNTPDLNDTWTWTGSNWVQQHPATVPTARTQASLAYDGISGQFILFGGQDATGYGVALNDTWIWTDSNWVQQHPRTAPALSATLQGRAVTFAHPGMVYNPITGKIMLALIGQGANDGTQTDYWTQANWTWNGSNWTEVNVTDRAVEEGQIFYDAHLHTVFELTSFQPRTSVNVENTLWKWTGQTWTIVESW